MKSPQDLRAIFNQVPLDYDETRPGYPKKLVQDVIAISNIPENGLILEIGCGTGQATLPFAERGYSMICLDIGQELIARAAQNCISYPKVKFEVAAFETWKIPESVFDLAISATAFHWIPPEVGYPKIAYGLKDSGYIALFWNYPPTPYTGFSQAVQTVYRQIVPEWEKALSNLSTNERIRLTELSINETHLYEPVRVLQYSWEKEYCTEAYLRLLNTYSDHRQLEESRKIHLFASIGELIEKQYNGVVTRSYLAVLYIAKKETKHS